jgi:hypothetical protein
MRPNRPWVAVVDDRAIGEHQPRPAVRDGLSGGAADPLAGHPQVGEEPLPRFERDEEQLSVAVRPGEPAREAVEVGPVARPEDPRPLGLCAGDLGPAEPALQRPSCNLHLWKLGHFSVRQLPRTGIKPGVRRQEESSMADLAKKYTAKSFPHLKGLKGISDGVLESHFKLYEGYVNRTNKLTETLFGLAKEGRRRAPTPSTPS